MIPNHHTKEQVALWSVDMAVDHIIRIIQVLLLNISNNITEDLEMGMVKLITKQIIIDFRFHRCL
jgi:hypothetical protein